MKKLKLSKITHRDEVRIQVLFEKDAEIIRGIKAIPGRRWSKTKNCWHLPYSKTSFNALKATFGEERLEYPKRTSEKNEISPKEEVSNTSPQLIEYRSNGKIGRKVVGEKVIVKKRTPEFLEAYVPFDKKGWTAIVRNIVGRYWDVATTCWLLPNVQTTYKHLYKYIGKESVVFDFEISADIPKDYVLPQSPKKVKKSSFDQLNDRQKVALNATIDKIILKQYSHTTLKSYKNHLIGIFLFYKDKLPDKITVKDIEDYLVHRIRFKKISESTQNQIISAYKIYAELVLGQSKQFIKIQRPKKPKDLPNVLSTEEVIKLIETPQNIKHQLLLLLIYSAGLRLSEVVGLRTRDINLNRRTIFIKAGKGKKDRYVTLAEAVIPYLKRYKSEYKPVYWLLEGQNGGQYSKRSVQNVFRSALEASKINAYATVHTLRHSYATHCIENGFSTALVQQSLGHASIKTTEKYLHVSSSALKKLRSPLDIIRRKDKNDL